ncbi:DUF1636 family protein [Alterinioella nitratireducens]|jgi:predicted metal-binding protein|uniref:DUF1636 family protein n=1 Tax=Alterinioella nitratireducens TaxID=2735915 RepID=UPI000C63DB1A|nr:metal-binding protein [Nioella sp.]|tara:strand:+ start:76 stop:447 length:372 start_codon:yes stop_codon:yes gene_type:complete
MAQVTLTVCTTCRKTVDGTRVAEEPRPGLRLYEALRAADLPEGVRVIGNECLSACDNGCSLVLSGGPERWTYIYSHLDPDTHVDEILKGAAAYAATDDGIVPWRDRPVIFRKQSLARIPPQKD